jgi:hypothetical protein
MVDGRSEKSTGKAACARKVAGNRLAACSTISQAVNTNRALEFRSQRGVFAIALLRLVHRQRFVPSLDPT